MRDTFGNKDTLSSKERELYHKRLKEKGILITQPQVIPRRGISGPCQLSFAQERLWFLDQLVPNNPFYNIPVAARLKGPLNEYALEQSLNEILRRHEVLRTTFSTVDGKPVQVVAKCGSFELPIIDLSKWSNGKQAAEVQRHLGQGAQRPFNLSQDLMLRATLLELDREDYILLLVIHHIASDVWSMGLLLKELSVIYEAFSDGKSSSLPELAIQYSDFAVWQRNWLQGKVLDSQLSYWKKQLMDLPILELPSECPRPPVESFKGATQSLILPKDRSDALKSLSRQEGVTLFMTLLAAFQTLLHRYTGQDDIIVGSPIAGRTRHEIEGLIGFFVNTLVLRTDLSGNPSFRELLSRVRKIALEAYDHQDLPYEKLVEELQPKRVPGQNPLFQVMFAFQNAPRDRFELSKLAITRVEIDKETSKFDLALVIIEKQEGMIILRMSYNTDLFKPTSIEKMLRNYNDLLIQLLKSPEKPISYLPKFTHQDSKLSKAAPREADHIFEQSNLTKNQLIIWMGQKMNPDVTIYNMGKAFKLFGKIDPHIFQKAFQKVIDSSDALRTVIREIDSEPQRAVLDDFPYKVEYKDFSHLVDPQAKLHSFMKERIESPYDFNVRLFDSALIKIKEDQFVWFLGNHQIILDAWSASLIHKHLLKLYQSFVTDRNDYELSLPKYEEYIKFEHTYRHSTRYTESEKYWKKKLTGGLEPLNFYGKNPLKVKQTTRVQRITHVLDLDRSQMLKKIATEPPIRSISSQLSLFNIFATILISYLYRITGTRRISLGIPFHNRSSKAFKETIGLFMEVGPLQIEISEGETFLSLLKKVQAEMFEILNHSQYGTGNPMQQRAYYEVMLNYQVVTFPSLDGLDTETEWLHSGHGSESLALQVHGFSGSGSVVIEFDFHTDLFGEQTRSRAIQHFLKTMDSFLEDRMKQINKVDLLTEEEKFLMVDKFNSRKLSFDQDKTVMECFEEQVKKSPDKVAVTYEEQNLTYAQLNARANKLAHYLQELGVGPEVLVGIYVERSVEMIIGIIGVLKAGGAYVPLNTNYPKERLYLMLSDSRPLVVLTQAHLLKDLPEVGANVICMDSDIEIISQHSTENPERASNGDDLAYVIYTSGTTGRPKGSMVTQKSLVNAFMAWEEAYSLSYTCSSHLQMANFSFDVFSGDVVRSLCSGAKLVLCPQEILLSPTKLYDLLREQEVDFAEFVPIVLRNLIENLDETQHSLNFIRLLVVGSDTLYMSDFNQAKRFCGNNTRLINSYGLTEATVDSLWFENTVLDLPDDGLVPIGRPFSNSQIYLLDTLLQPVPLGVPGELYIGGIGVARGYLNRPDLTAEKFIPNPFSAEPGERLFKTGDLARYLTDGNIEFLGRIDNQVKIRGFRVELGEIEAVLREHPYVNDAVVVAREDIPGEKHLVAYVVPGNEQALTISELRSYLREKLPEYMIPSAFVMMDTFPLTSNGKVDRRALPVPDQTRPELDDTYVPPSNPIEEVLVGIWAEVLGIDRVGVRDNFFDLGGHSLLSTQLISRIRKVFQVELPLRSVFETPNLEKLAELIETICSVVRSPQHSHDNTTIDREEGEI